MLIKRAYKTKLDLTNKQKGYFIACAGVSRFVFNWALADRKVMFESGGKPSIYEQKKRFNALKHESFPWLSEYPYIVVQEAFGDLDMAYQNFFRRVKDGSEKAGFPKFKSRHKTKKSFRVRGSITIKQGKIKLPKIGWVRLAEKSYIPTDGYKLLFATISEQAGDWFVSAQVEIEITDMQPASDCAIGVDVGIKSLAVCSDGVTFDNPKTLGKHTKKLARLQRELNRRVKGSSNRLKTKAKIAKLHQKISDTRKHTLHNISRHVTANTMPKMIVIEDLHVKGMTANHKLAKAIADASMSELRRQIEYKAAWHNIEVMIADRWYPSSKTCSGCGNIKQFLTLAERVYSCDACGLTIDRDLNAALNLAALANKPVMHGSLSVELTCSNASL